MNAALWGLQALVAVFFTAGAATRAVAYDFAKQQMAWVAAVPRPLLLFISAAEILGAIGLLAPGLTRIDPVLTPLAAALLGVVIMLAIGFHLVRNELRLAGGATLVLGLLAVVALGRLFVVPL